MSGKKEWWDTGEFTFFRLPRAVIDNKKYAALSGDAKLLYALLVNRLSLSASNGWRDGAGEVFLYFTNAEICRTLGCASGKATGLLRALEGCGLIRRVRQGLCRPDRIYVLPPEGMVKYGTGKAGNRSSGTPETTTPESGKPLPRKKEERKKEIRQNDPILSYTDAGAARGAMAPRQIVENMISPLRGGSFDPSLLEEISDLLYDVCTDPSPVIRVDGQVRSRDKIRQQLLALDRGRLEAVLEQAERGTVPRQRPELLAALCRRM